MNIGVKKAQKPIVLPDGSVDYSKVPMGIRQRPGRKFFFFSLLAAGAFVTLVSINLRHVFSRAEQNTLRLTSGGKDTTIQAPSFFLHDGNIFQLTINNEKVLVDLTGKSKTTLYVGGEMFTAQRVEEPDGTKTAGTKPAE